MRVVSPGPEFGRTQIGLNHLDLLGMSGAGDHYPLCADAVDITDRVDGGDGPVVELRVANQRIEVFILRPDEFQPRCRCYVVNLLQLVVSVSVEQRHDIVAAPGAAALAYDLEEIRIVGDDFPYFHEGLN